jgi:hypothetical protein
VGGGRVERRGRVGQKDSGQLCELLVCVCVCVCVLRSYDALSDAQVIARKNEHGREGTVRGGRERMRE